MSSLRVVKVGGSLFSRPSLAADLRAWLARESRLPTVLLAGGGPFVRAVRSADERFALGEETSHWLAIRAMSLSSRLLAALLPEAVFEDRGVNSLERSLAGSSVGANAGARGLLAPLMVFCPEYFLKEEEPRLPAPLPHSWCVTSDSIAARLAEALAAEELVLLKSAAFGAGRSRVAAAESGYVDRYFPRAAAPLSQVRAVHLSGSEFESSWLS